MPARGTCCDDSARGSEERDRLYRRIGFMGGCNAILNQEWPGILNCGLVCALVARASRCRKFRPKLALFTEIHLSVGLLSLGLEI